MQTKKFNTFKSLKKELIIYDYCKIKIKKGESFRVIDIANDLHMGRTTVIDHLQQLSRKYNDFTYSGGNISIIGLGTNGLDGNEGLKVSYMNRTTKNRIEKKKRVYDYLCELVRNNQPIPNLSQLHKDGFIDMHVSTLMKILVELHKDNKIIYSKGKILGVNVPSAKSSTGKEYKFNKPTEETTEIVEETTENVETTEENYDNDINIFTMVDYDKAVKDLIAEYILNADITSKEDILRYINGIMNITDKIRDKLNK